MKNLIRKKILRFALLGCIFLILTGYFIVPKIYGLQYTAKSEKNSNQIQNVENINNGILSETQVALVGSNILENENIIVTHIETPKEVRAVYVSSWVAGSSYFSKIIKMIDETELNAIVIDIKDSGGKISFPVSNPDLIKINSSEERIKKIKTLIDLLHKKNIYVIGRMVTFQDSFLAKKWPEFAVKKMSDKNALWQDYKCARAIKRGQEKSCTYWLDAGSKKVWDYIASIGDEAYANGFDEINFDYIRFPADGNLKDIYYPVSEGRTRIDVMNEFLKFLHDNFTGEQGDKNPRPKISADIFGLVTTEINDLGIGQNLIPFATYFDYIMPMTYPSHYAPDTYGYKNPATKPYEIVNYSLKKAVERLKIVGLDPLKIRPWLQDFNMGATYTPEMVRAQMQATYDTGLNSWSLWDPANTYTESALLPEK